MEGFVTAILVLVILGVALWLLEKYLPIDPVIKTVIRVLVVIAMVLYLLHTFGIWHGPVFRG